MKKQIEIYIKDFIKVYPLSDQGIGFLRATLEACWTAGAAEKEGKP